MSAYYCSPFKGSDWRVGWSRAIQASSKYDVFVITSEVSRTDIETYLSRNESPRNVQFFFVGADRADRWLCRIPKSFLYVNPVQYSHWHRGALKLARQLHRKYKFDLAHQVTLIGYRQPGKLHELGIPLVWGPIGGTQNFPTRFLPSAGLSGALREGTRALVNALQMRYSIKVRKAMQSASVVLAANSEAQHTIRKHHKRDAVLLLETGLDVVDARPVTSRCDMDLRILWSGDLQTHKALHLLLRALGSVRDRMGFQLRILGRGPLRDELQGEAQRLGIDHRCEFVGFLPLAEAMKQSEWADVFVFTSLRDTSGNVMLEAMSRGVPVICFNHQGARDIVTESSGIKLPVRTPEDAVRGLAEALVRVANDRELLSELSEGALVRAQEFLWSKNTESMFRIYNSVLTNSVKGTDRRKLASYIPGELAAAHQGLGSRNG
ncbi:MAG TPA: glycosyltransferase family 4 protein [Bryobacteraceae bacterium]|nr:glycosyltransferase family 4 protein [Bryobacteraceae bacterium]